MLAASDPLWYLLAAPLSIAIAIAAIWFSQRGEREARKESERKRDLSDLRLHGAVFGYTEGATKVPGIFDIVVGNGSGESLSDIAKDAREEVAKVASTAVVLTDRAEDNRVAIAALDGKVEAHIVEDSQRWDEIAESLGDLKIGQTDAAAVASGVAATAVKVAAEVAQKTLDTALEVDERAKAAAKEVAETAVNVAEELHRSRVDGAEGPS